MARKRQSEWGGGRVWIGTSTATDMGEFETLKKIFARLKDVMAGGIIVVVLFEVIFKSLSTST